MSTTYTPSNNPHDSCPSLSASMEDFESQAVLSSSAFLRTKSHPHLHFRSPVASEYSDCTDATTGTNLEGSWSPPVWRKAGSGWFKHQQGLASPMRSREGSPEKIDEDVEALRRRREGEYFVDEDEDVTTAAEIPLPGSPVKGRSLSRSLSPERMRSTPSERGKGSAASDLQRQRMDDKDEHQNYIRFSVRADVQHRTEPIEEAVLFLRKGYARMFKSRYTTFMSLVMALSALTILRALLQPPLPGPTPDLVKVAGLAKSLEPLMYYGENGHTQVVQLGETGVAVWDLGESVRQTNMTSGPIIVKSLDELSETLKNLAMELTRFFANIDGDIDSILIVMEWAQRELSKINSAPPSAVSSAFSNMHTILSRVGVLENSRGTPTTVGKLVQDVFGQTAQQVTRSTLQRTFNEFLGVLEESINNEITASMSLFIHFEAIDRQFLNLQRTVIRETDAQEREEGEELSRLWTRLVGGNASRLRKFEKNKQLLSSLRERTVRNKHVLVDHNGRLLQLRSNLEILRKKLVSPLVRSNESGSTLSVDEQIKGLEGTYSSLKATREAQKARLYNLIHEASAGTRRVAISGESGGYGIEDR